MSIDKDNLSSTDGQEKRLEAPETTTETNSSDSSKVEETTDEIPENDSSEKSTENPEPSPEADKAEETQLTAEDTTGVAPVHIHGESPEQELTEEMEKLPQENLTVGDDVVSTKEEEEEEEEEEEVEKSAESKEETSETLKSEVQESDETANLDQAHKDNLKEETEADKSAESKDASSSEEISSEKSKSQSKDFDETADHDQAQQDDAEETEEETEAVPHKDYDEMSLGDMVIEAKDLVVAYAPILLREAFGNLRDAFRKKADEIEAFAREKFLEEGGNAIDFRHDNPHGTSFFDTYTEYRSKVDAHYKEQEAQQDANLKERESIIQNLKSLYTEPSENNSQIFRKFRDLKTRWHNAGRIPKAQAGNIFKTYYFHLDNFNEFLDLNQELRKMDYEHNLEVRYSIIERAKALLAEDNVQKALNELQYLHRMWKEEGVPVAEEKRELTWLEFKDLTSKIHDRKTELNEQLQQKQLDNLEKKNNVIKNIAGLIEGDIPKTHNAWQKKIKEMKSLRDEFFAIGRVPRENNQPAWDAFKDASKNFNHEKNTFYKNMKVEQMENLEKKRKLVDIAKEHSESSDWNESVQVVKRIQSDWKKIGHVPRKFSDKIWKEFSQANNLFFDRYKNRNNERLEKQQDNLDEKLALLEEMKTAEKPSEKKALLAWLNDYSVKWSTIGYVPNGKQDINRDFASLSEKLLQDAGLDKNAIAQAQWENQLDRIKTTLDDNALRNLRYDTRKQIDDVQKDVTHLQTNLAFFTNADETNPLFKNAIQNIENKVSELKALESKYEDLKHINLESIAAAQEAEAERLAEEAKQKAEADAQKAAEEAEKLAEEEKQKAEEAAQKATEETDKLAEEAKQKAETENAAQETLHQPSETESDVEVEEVVDSESEQEIQSEEKPEQPKLESEGEVDNQLDSESDQKVQIEEKLEEPKTESEASTSEEEE